MNELVVISGKGGIGKTSLTASLAMLAGESLNADCDVDAPERLPEPGDGIGSEIRRTQSIDGLAPLAGNQ